MTGSTEVGTYLLKWGSGWEKLTPLSSVNNSLLLDHPVLVSIYSYLEVPGVRSLKHRQNDASFFLWITLTEHLKIRKHTHKNSQNTQNIQLWNVHFLLFCTTMKNMTQKNAADFKTLWLQTCSRLKGRQHF
jgi:hypothetical protein